VWLVELAPVGDAAAVPDAVAAALGVTTQAGFTVTESIARALSGRRMLIVLDNCEHVLDDAAALVATIVAQATPVKVMATSREGLRIGAEQLWSVPSLDVEAGAGSAAIALFVERAQAVVTAFDIHDEDDATAVTEICRQLDGIALAIELAAARMVSMTPTEVLGRLTDRFRLLSGPRRGLERHHTLRDAVGWSYDLLGDDECRVLDQCSVFAGGFDLAAATHVCGGPTADEYAVLDRLDSLVRKSLVTVERVNGHTRYGLLETIRQFAQERLAAAGSISAVRDRHAAYFAEQAVVHWDMWDGPRYRAAVDWGDVEAANLRAAFHWAADHDDPATAAAVAAHAALLNWALQRFEAAGWAEEVLAAATSADVRCLPRLHTAASLCMFTGRADAALGYVETAVALANDPRYDSIEPGLVGILEGTAHTFSGRIDRCLEMVGALVIQPASARVAGLCGTLYTLPAVGRIEEAAAIVEETVAAARGRGNPFYVAFALAGYGRTFAATDPARALSALRDGLAIAREHRIPIWEGIIAPDAAQLEAAHGELEYALGLFDASLDSQHRAGNLANSGTTLVSLAVLFDRIEQPHVAANLYGACTHHASISFDIYVSDVLTHLRSVLGDAAFDECVSIGVAMGPAEAVAYAHGHIQQARRHLEHDATCVRSLVYVDALRLVNGIRHRWDHGDRAHRRAAGGHGRHPGPRGPKSAEDGLTARHTRGYATLWRRDDAPVEGQWPRQQPSGNRRSTAKTSKRRPPSGPGCSALK
jgi:predicted ATPase